MDREKVIKGLECCTFILGKRKCNECPYQKSLPDNGCYQLQDDFHALLKEQEVKTVIKIAKRFNDCDLTGYCPFCSRPLIKDWAENYCGYCGKPVLWEGGEVNEID